MSDHTTSRGSGAVRAGRELALTIGAIAGLICVLAAAASLLFGIKPLVFRSGSMSPEITTGSLAFARTVPATDLAVGDVVSVVNGQGTRITHRVYDLEQQAGNVVAVKLKGDANANPDIEPYVVTEADRIFFSVGGLGYAVAWLSSPFAIFLGGILVAGLLITAFRPPSRRNDSGDGPSSGSVTSESESVETKEFSFTSSNSGAGAQRSPMMVRKLTILGISALAVLGATQVSGTAAAFTHDGFAKSGALTLAANITPPPASVRCDHYVNTNDARVKWTHLGPRYRYEVRYMWTGQTAPMQTWSVDPGVGAAAGTEVSRDISSEHAGYSVGTSYTYTVRIYTIERSNNQVSATWNGWNVSQGASSVYVSCSGPASGVQGFSGGDVARGVSPTTTTSAATATTAPATSTTTTTDVIPTTETSTSATESATPTTSTSATTTTTTPSKEVSIAVGDPETSSNGDTATLMQTSAGVAVVVTNSAGKEISSTPVGATAEVKWQSDSEVLWIVDGTDIYQVSSTGKSTKATAADAPADIAAWIDGLK